MQKKSLRICLLPKTFNYFVELALPSTFKICRHTILVRMKTKKDNLLLGKKGKTWKKSTALQSKELAIICNHKSR